jgi:hypothetical protein
MEGMRTIAVVLVLAAAAVTSCDAETFYCVSLEAPTTNPPGPGHGCFCKADGRLCDDLGTCIAECPLP